MPKHIARTLRLFTDSNSRKKNEALVGVLERRKLIHKIFPKETTVLAFESRHFKFKVRRAKVLWHLAKIETLNIYAACWCIANKKNVNDLPKEIK